MSLYSPVLATYRLEHTPKHRIARTLSAWSIGQQASIATFTALGGAARRRHQPAHRAHGRGTADPGQPAAAASPRGPPDGDHRGVTHKRRGASPIAGATRRRHACRHARDRRASGRTVARSASRGGRGESARVRAGAVGAGCAGVRAGSRPVGDAHAARPTRRPSRPGGRRPGDDPRDDRADAPLQWRRGRLARGDRGRLRAGGARRPVDHHRRVRLRLRGQPGRARRARGLRRLHQHARALRAAARRRRAARVAARGGGERGTRCPACAAGPRHRSPRSAAMG